MAIKRVYIDQNVADDPQTQAILAGLSAPSIVIQNPRELFQTVLNADDPVRMGKELLFLTENRGAFIRSCPGTRDYTCCDYMILHIGSFCTMDCAYCILQSYFHPPVLTYFINRTDLSKEIDRMFSDRQIRRIGTGEFTDSMIWELWTEMSNYLVPKFSDQSYTVLELKTKTTAVAALEDLQHNRKTIVSWSLNTPGIISSEERQTATLEARLKAAARCESWGYPLGFHFDPMVIYEGCEVEYRSVVEQVFSHVSPENVAWISLGTFRFIPSLKFIIQSRFPDSKIVYGEFVHGLDGKMRYFRPLRVELYRRMVSWIRSLAPDVLIYFCMEDEQIWKKCIGFSPEEKGGLPKMLDKRAVQICGLDDK